MKINSAANANSLMSNASSFLNWAVNEDLLARNPARGLRLADPINKRDKRFPFEHDQLHAKDNYVDQRVRTTLRERYNRVGIDAAEAGPVRVNRPENDSTGGELTYRRADARVDEVAFDMIPAHKTIKTPQVCEFSNADFRPSRVIMIRPRQIGADYAYAISRPEKKR